MSWRRKWAGLSVRPSKVRNGRQKDAPTVEVRQVSSNQDPPTHGQGILEDMNYVQSTVKIPNACNASKGFQPTKDSMVQQPQATAGPWLLLTGRIPLQNYNRGNKDFSHFPSPYLHTLSFPLLVEGK